MHSTQTCKENFYEPALRNHLQTKRGQYTNAKDRRYGNFRTGSQAQNSVRPPDVENHQCLPEVAFM